MNKDNVLNHKDKDDNNVSLPDSFNESLNTFIDERKDIELNNNTESKTSPDNKNNLTKDSFPGNKRLIESIIENLKFNKYIVLMFIILSFFFLADGGEMVVISLIVNKLEAQWGLSSTEKGFIGGAVFIGFFFGTLVGGKLSDSKGRKPVFILGSLLVFVFGIISAFSPSYWFLIIMRALFGFGVGISIPASTSLLTELTPVKHRSCVLTMVWFSFPIGEFISIIIAQNVLGLDNGWRYLLIFVAIPSFFAFVTSLCMIESPRFYYAKGEYNKAADILNVLLKTQNKPELTADERLRLQDEGNKDKNMPYSVINRRISISEEDQSSLDDISNNLEKPIEDIHQIPAKINEAINEDPKFNIELDEKGKKDKLTKPKRQKSSYTTLCSRKFIRLTILICLLFFTNSFIYYGLVYILPQNLLYLNLKDNIRNYLMNQTNVTDIILEYNPEYNRYNITHSNLINDNKLIEELSFISNFTNHINSHHTQDETNMLNGLFLSVLLEIPSNIISIFLANFRFLGRKGSMSFGFILTGISGLLCIFLIDYIFIFAALLKFAINIPFSIIYIYTCEAYPTNVRSIGVGFSNSFNRIAGILTPLISQVMFNYRVYFPYIIYTTMAFTGSILSLLLPYETLGRKLEDN